MSDRINRKIPILELSNSALDLIGNGARYFSMGQCRIIVSKDPPGWHLSISCPNRDPTWDEIVTARYRLLPDVPEMSMHFPRLSKYLNLHPHVFHLHECKEDS